MPTGFEPNARFEEQRPKPFLKTRFGVLFIFILALLGITFVIFGIMTGYYLYKIKTGKTEEIEKQLRQTEFSFSGTESSSVPITSKDVIKTIRGHNPTNKNAGAPITIVIFIDFECPFCQKSYPIFTKIINKYEGAINLVFKHFPIESLHPLAVDASVAATCAGDQEKFWEYYDMLFITKKLDVESLSQHAIKLGLNTSVFESCRQSPKKLININEDLQDGIKLGVRGTPTYFINGIKIEGVITEKQWDTILLDQLK